MRILIGAIDVDLLPNALPGVHDFSRFARVEGKNPERKIFSAELIPDKEGVIFEIHGEKDAIAVFYGIGPVRISIPCPSRKERKIPWERLRRE